MSNDSRSATAPLYSPAPGEAQLTLRAVLAGCLVGSVVSCTNIYIGLKIGWSFGASIVAAVLSFAVFAAAGRRLSVLETNIAQTAGSAAGYMSSAAGLLAPIPALQMSGYEFTWQTLMLWAYSVGFLGVFFAVPLRRQMVLVEQLRFPTGTATAETVMAMQSGAGDAMLKAKALVFAALGAFAFALLAHFYPKLEAPPLHEITQIGFLITAANWGFTIALGPALYGAGFLIGPRVVLSLVLGAVIGWGVLAYQVQSQGWAPGKLMDFKTGPRGWILWPGVALMVSEALASLAFSWRTFLRALFPQSGAEQVEDPAAAENIPTSWWTGGLLLGSCLAAGVSQGVFGIPWYLSLVAIALSSVLAVVAVRSTGETDINPVGGMGKVTQLVFGGIAPGNAT
ncbi:MAG: OPT/YSL family transporter, partial [Planctomycetales bacterium]|nr:OPT/YSL family transporter [Planctomycetales bacterium]